MSSNMEVDTPRGEDETRIAVHPLAIVHMSDQYTRITCGGSCLPKDAPVVGLLFGKKAPEAASKPGLKTSENPTASSVWQIKDADDIPTDASEASTIQVDLHKAVFPQHSVVGWYRVSASPEEEPTAKDLQITQHLEQHYVSGDDTGNFFCFCLLQVKNEEEDSKPAARGESAADDDETLPINLYGLRSIDGASILLGLTNWQLDTSEPERIAVERVMKEQNHPSATCEDGSMNPANNAYVSHAKSVKHSFQSLQDRVQILIQFLQDTKDGKLAPNFSLLRQVQGLIFSLGPLGGAASPSSGTQDDALILSHLAAVAKTVQNVQSYTDKFRVMHENRTVGKEMRRAF